jgi:hypothetical protein
MERPGERPSPLDQLPDVRDGLNRVERAVLHVLHEAKRELGDRHVSTFLLYGRVLERVDISQAEFQRVLQRLTGRG